MNEIRKVFILSPKLFYFDCDFENAEIVEWNDIIEYKYFYRLLQEIDNSTLIVLNECLRLKNRNDLTYNCIRHFLNQTRHQLVFQYLPIIEDREDFMVLFDFDTRSQWKRNKFDIELLKESKIKCNKIELIFNKIEIDILEETKERYLKEKEKLIKNIGLKDPHTIPRNLYLLSGKEKYKYTGHGNGNQGSLFCDDSKKQYIGRNNRFKIENFSKYNDKEFQGRYIVFELPHNHIDFVTFLSLSKQIEIDILVAGLKVDQWYWERYQKWINELQYVYSAVQ